VTEWEEGKTITIEVYELNKMPGIDNLSLALSVAPAGESSVLRGTMTYTMKNVLFDIMNALMMKRMNSQLLDGIMAGHKKYMETGEIVNEKTPLDLTQVLHVA